MEPVIGHLKDDSELQRNWLKGPEGDVLYPVLCAAGYKLRWLMQAVVRLGLKALLVLCLLVGMLRRVVSGNAAWPLGGRLDGGCWIFQGRLAPSPAVLFEKSHCGSHKQVHVAQPLTGCVPSVMYDPESRVVCDTRYF